jgi:hypothetical protein
MKTDLIVMRLADMKRVHPDQITARCAICQHEVAVYPSGQRMMKHYPGGVRLTCQVCKEPADISVLAPGAEFERLQSVPAKGKVK